MKNSFALFAVGMIPAMIFAADFTLKPTSLWKKTADNAAKIDYDGRKAWPHLRLKTAEALKPNTLYRVKFEAKSTVPNQVSCSFHAVFQGKKQQIVTRFMPTADFKKYTCYFNSGEDPKGTPSIYFDPTSAFQLEVKNIKLDEMTDDLLYGQNLLAWGDFEEDNTFLPGNKKLKDAVKIVDSANFMSGEKSLLLDCPEGKTAAVTSGFIPAVPGKEIEVKFYAKSEEPAKIQVTLNWWMSGSKHLYRTFQFKTEKEWKEYTLKYKVPEDSETYPALLRKLMTCIRFSGRSLSKDGSSKICFDDISYMMERAPSREKIAVCPIERPDRRQTE